MSEVFRYPRSPAVAALLGIPNTHPGRVGQPGSILSGGLELTAPTGDLPPGTDILWTVPPEAIALDPAGAYAATVTDSVELGSRRELRLSAAELELTARIGTEVPLPGPGSSQRIELPAEAIAVWAAVSR